MVSNDTMNPETLFEHGKVAQSMLKEPLNCVLVTKVEARNSQVCLVKMRFFAILPYCGIWRHLATMFFWKYSSSLNVEHLWLVRASLCLDGNQHRKMLDLIFGVSPKAFFELIFKVTSFQHVTTSLNSTFYTFSLCLNCWHLAERIVKITIQSKQKWS